MIRIVTAVALCLGLAPLASGTQQETTSQPKQSMFAQKLQTPEVQQELEQQRAQLEQAVKELREAKESLEYNKRNVEMEIENSSVANAFQQLNTLETMAFEIRLSRAEFGARRNVMERHVMELDARLKAALQEDAMTVHLKQSMQKIEELLSGFAGTARPAGDAFEGHFRLAELAVELGARSDQVYERSGGAQFQSLKDRLLDVDIELNVLDAKEAVLRVELERAKESRKERAAQRRHLLELESEIRQVNSAYNRATLRLLTMSEARQR